MEAAAQTDGITTTVQDLPRETSAAHLVSTRIPALDGIRGLAVLMVLVFHYHQGMLSLPEFWLTEPLHFLNFGQTGVDLFFVLSGFLITGILLNAKGSPHFLRMFYMRRILRILPLYYLVVLGFLVTGWISAAPSCRFDRVWWYLVYLQNLGMTFWPRSVGGPGHFWSLGVEEHFYLFWPFLILLCSEKKLPLVLLVVISFALVSRVGLLSMGYDVFTFSLSRMDALALGALLAVLLRRPALAYKTTNACRWSLAISGPVLLFCYPLTSGKALFGMQVIKYTLIALCYTTLIGVTVGLGGFEPLRRLFENKFLRWCGKYSYAMYVFHVPLYGAIMTLVRSSAPLAQMNPGRFMVCEFSICVLTTFLAAWISWHLFEGPLLGLKRHFEYRRSSKT